MSTTSLSASKRSAAARRGHCPCPSRSSAELTINALSEDQRREWEAANGRNVGYQFSWGQIHEDPAPPDVDVRPGEIAVEWHFVLSKLHAEFLWAGGCLGELSDCCVAMLEQAEGCAREEPHQEVLPAYVSFCEGNLLSAFSIQVWGSANLPAAREWVADTFIPGILPIVVENVSRINHEAGRDASD